MKKVIIALVVSVVYITTGAAKSNSNNGLTEYADDEQLITSIHQVRYRVNRAGHRWWQWHQRQLIVALRATVENGSDKTVNGPFRVALDIPSWMSVVNESGYNDYGQPVVTVCEQCDIAPSANSKKFTIKLKMPLRKAWHWYKKVDFIAEYKPFKLQLLHAADMDGTAGALQNVSAFSAILNKFREQYPDNTIVLSSGDNYIPGPRFAACADESLGSLIGVAGAGRCDICLMNIMGFQASAVGNHDLDAGTSAFAGIIAPEINTISGGIYAGAKFPYLSANLDFSTDASLAELVTANGQLAMDMSGKLAAYTTITVAGETIGVVGATTPALASITSTGDITITPEDSNDLAGLATAIQASVDELTMQGVDKIILVSHMQQIAIEKELASRLQDVDVIIAGGSNTLLADDNDPVRDGDIVADTYPLIFESSAAEPVLVVNTDGDYKYLGRLISQFDLQGRIRLSSLNNEINGAYATDDVGLEAVGNPASNLDVDAIVQALTDILVARDGSILGKSIVYLDGRRASVRAQETNLGNLTADANLALAKQVDSTTAISIKNGGGIRSEIGFVAFPPGSTDVDDLQFFPTAPNPAAGKLAGDISQFDLETTLRFNNGLTLLTVSAVELQAIVEHAVSATEPGATPGRFPQVSGLRFSFDPALAASQRLRNLAVVDANGAIIDAVVQKGILQGDASRTFRLVTLNFLADGGDGFPFPDTERLDLVGSGLVPTGLATFTDEGSEQDALAEFLLNNFSSAMPYGQAETPMEEDQRIQNLSVRADSVF